MNVGTIDRTIRVVVGLVMAVLAFAGALGAWAWIGVVLLLTGIIGVCPLYKLFGINTCPTSDIDE
ncbi:MAG: DUF2892 domain-containing protein [Pseudomonadota bacterium]|nr:DUF2892 domain-containing protein [Pseudomonadota bacterium]